MEVVITATPEQAAAVAADAIERLLASSRHPVLGLATGSSPLPTYRELIARHTRGQLSFAAARAFLLDEYVGLPTDHPESYRSFIRRQFTDHIDLPVEALWGPDGAADDVAEAARPYERRSSRAAESTCKCSVSVATATSGSTNRPRRSRRGPDSNR